MTFEQVISRIRRALMLDETVFVEVRDDVVFTLFALASAAVAVLIGGIGSFLWGKVVLDSTPDGFLLDTIVLGSFFLIILWAIGVLVTYLILAQLYREEVTTDGLARVLALCHVPFALSLLVFLPEIGFGFGVLAIAAMFFYSNIGLRAAYPNIAPMRIMVSVFAGFAVWTMFLPILTGHDNAFAPGTFIFEWTGDVAESVSSDLSNYSDFQQSFEETLNR
jgi:hypothetical protein